MRITEGLPCKEMSETEHRFTESFTHQGDCKGKLSLISSRQLVRQSISVDLKGCGSQYRVDVAIQLATRMQTFEAAVYY
jgi:hypothetical protein